MTSSKTQLETLRELKVAQLKTQLAKFKLSTSGKKAELIKRLLDHGWSGGGTTVAEHGCSATGPSDEHDEHDEHER